MNAVEVRLLGTGDALVFRPDACSLIVVGRDRAHLLSPGTDAWATAHALLDAGEAHLFEGAELQQLARATEHIGLLMPRAPGA